MTNQEFLELQQTWETEKELYNNIAIKLKDELIEVLSDAHLPFSIKYRRKDDSSLYKKVISKKKAYSEINDKAGVRIIVQFRSDLARADELIVKSMKDRIEKRDNKLETTDDNSFGYLSIHYDISTKMNDKNYICELQLRTICQNAWSELSHVLNYKPDCKIPTEISREINALSALLEIADNQFQHILDMVNYLPVSAPIRLLRLINDYFYSNVSGWYDSDMSMNFLRRADTLYEKEEKIEILIDNFIRQNGGRISKIAKEKPNLFFFSQPEIIIILERLERRQKYLVHYWNSIYPFELLEEIAIEWGISLD